MHLFFTLVGASIARPKKDGKPVPYKGRERGPLIRQKSEILAAFIYALKAACGHSPEGEGLGRVKTLPYEGITLPVRPRRTTSPQGEAWAGDS